MSASSTISGYRKKPASIYRLAAIFVCLPVISIAQIYHEIGFTQNLFQVAKSEFFLIELFGCWSAALALLSFSKPGFYYFLILTAYSLISKAHHLVTTSFVNPWEFVIALIWLSTSLVILLSHLRLPYLHPQLRWWAQPPRYQHIAYGKLCFNELRFPIVTLNLSRGGAFVKLDERLLTRTVLESFTDERRNENIIGDPHNSEEERWVLKQLDGYPKRLGEYVKLEMSLKPEVAEALGHEKLNLKAEIVWVAKQHSPYQFGLGLRFTDYLECLKLKKYLKYFETHFPARS